MTGSDTHVLDRSGGSRRDRAAGGRSPLRLPVRARKWLVALHVVSSVGWLGLTIGNLTMGITGMTTDDPATQHAVYRVMAVLGDTLLIPISLTAFATGVLLALGTTWGLMRHRWVVVKLWLTLFAVIMTPFSLLPGIHENLAIVASTPAGQLAATGQSGVGVIFAGSVSLTMYTTCTVLSSLKPWGRTRYGRRKLATR